LEGKKVGITVKPIGFIRSCYKEKFGTPRQSGLAVSSHAIIELLPHVQPEESLSGLETFSHIWLIFLFHQNTNNAFSAKVSPPRLAGKKMGVFATRSPHRPNFIGLSLVSLEKIEKNKLYLSGIDLVDGTPILDIKPYLADAESVPNASSGWTAGLETKTLPVKFDQNALNDAATIAHKAKLIALIQETLSLDPRPTIYKGDDLSPNPYREIYGCLIDDYNVQFSINEGIVTVLSIKFND
jgi:tRNA (adenine37-N6)-methyltransferase